MKGSNRMVPFLDLWTEVLTMLVSWARQTWGRSRDETRKKRLRDWDARRERCVYADMMGCGRGRSLARVRTGDAL